MPESLVLLLHAVDRTLRATTNTATQVPHQRLSAALPYAQQHQHHTYMDKKKQKNKYMYIQTHKHTHLHIQ